MRPIISIIVALLLTTHASPASAEPPPPSRTKLWATDLSAYLNERPGDWVVGRSIDPALSAAEAESYARRDAAGPIFERLRPRVPRSRWRALSQKIQDTLAAGDWVVDRRLESTVRPYGTIWSAAVLAEASPQRCERLVREVEREARRQRERVALGGASATVMAVVVGSFYLALNWLTRGFLRGRLLTASALILAIGIFGIVHLI